MPANWLGHTTKPGRTSGRWEWSETALVLAERLDDTELLARAIGSKSHALFNLGRQREAVILARGHIALAEAAGSFLEQALGWTMLSFYISGDEPREGLSAAMESAELARRAGHRGIEIVNLINGAEGSLFLGEWSDTRVTITELRQRDLPLEQRAMLSCTEGLLAALTGNPEEASARFERADRMAATEMVTGRASYLMDRSFVSLATGDIEAARRESAEAVLADPTGINAWDALAPGTRLPLAARRGRCASSPDGDEGLPRPMGCGGAAHSGGRVGCPRRASGGGG